MGGSSACGARATDVLAVMGRDRAGRLSIGDGLPELLRRDGLPELLHCSSTGGLNSQG